MTEAEIVARALCKLRGWHYDTSTTWAAYQGLRCTDCGAIMPFHFWPDKVTRIELPGALSEARWPA